MRELAFTPRFVRQLRRLPTAVRRIAYEKLELLLQNPGHPSLRVKRMRGNENTWEMSVTMNYRITFQMDDESIMLRRIGTHDVLRKP